MSLSPHPFKHYTGPVGSKSTGVYLDALLSYEIGSYEISRLTRMYKNDEYLESINLGSRNSAAKVKMREITKKRVGGGGRRTREGGGQIPKKGEVRKPQMKKKTTTTAHTTPPHNPPREPQEETTRIRPRWIHHHSRRYIPLTKLILHPTHKQLNFGFVFVFIWLIF